MMGTGVDGGMDPMKMLGTLLTGGPGAKPQGGLAKPSGANPMLGNAGDLQSLVLQQQGPAGRGGLDPETLKLLMSYAHG